MIIYKDKSVHFSHFISGGELFTDAFAVKEDGECFVFRAKQVTRKGGDIDDKMFGGNASAEEVQEESESSVETGLDFALNGRLQQGYMNTKKDYQGYFKQYAKDLQHMLFPDSKDVPNKDLPADVKEYHKRAKSFFEKIMEWHKDIVPYFSETDEESKGSCCFAKYLEDGVTADVYVFRDGILCEKV